MPLKFLSKIRKLNWDLASLCRKKQLVKSLPFYHLVLEIEFYLHNSSRVGNLWEWFVVGWGLVLSRQGCEDGLGAGIWQRAEIEICSDSWVRLLRLVTVVKVSFSLFKMILLSTRGRMMWKGTENPELDPAPPGMRWQPHLCSSLAGLGLVQQGALLPFL